MNKDNSVAINLELVHQLKWYYWPRCPLLPDWRIKQADKWNTWGFHFHWLVFRAWTSDAPMLGFQVELDDSQLQIRLNIPYLWTGIFIPIFPINLRHRFWRKVNRDSYDQR